MGPVTKLVSSRDNKLPYVILDSDKVGKEYHRQLISGAYKDQRERVLEIGSFIAAGDKAFEIEDLLPAKKIVETVDRIFRGASYFDEFYKPGEPVVDQIEKWALNNNIELEKNGWKMELARKVINQFDRIMNEIPTELEQSWNNLFQILIQ